MKNWTIGKRITFGFATILVLVTVLAITSFLLLKHSSDIAIALATDPLPGALAMNDLNGSAGDAQNSLLSALLSNTPEKVKQNETGIATISVKLDKAMSDYEATIHQTEDRDNFNQLTTCRAANSAARNKVLALLDDGKKDEAIAYFWSTQNATYDAYMAILDKMTKWNFDLATKYSNDSAGSVKLASGVTSILSIVVIILGIIFAVTIIVGLKKVLAKLASALNDGSAQVASAAGQVSSASQTLAEGASEQAASLEETSSSLEEMASMTKRNSENAQKANDLAKQARTAADKGSADMQTMGTAMEAIKTSSDDIAKIIKTIDEIAFQTNILALNAAVEAARAGEAGMGFAVVADEVRNLAQRSAQAAKETAGKIEGAIAKTAQGVDISSKVAVTLNEIVTKVRQVDELVAEVAGASREQTQGITQINTAVGQMDKVTQSNAANAEESAAAAEELNAQATTMKESVTELLQLVGGNGQTTVTRTTATPSRNKEVHIVAPIAKRLAPIHGNGNGHAHDDPTTAGATNGRSQIPLEGDFKDF